MNLQEPEPKVNLLENIALNFSGGGFRAASFSLGVLSYLHHFHFNGKPLIQNVKGISTVSGGSITGAAFAIASAKKMPFPEFYNQLCAFMKGDELLRKALSKMEDEEVWKNNHKRQSLINAFSLAYQEMLSDETMDLLLNSKDSNLQDVCINATDFSFGLAFRFQIGGQFGNYQLHCKELNDAKGQVKLADAVAASSCFPMGFEPILFPDDFISDQATLQSLRLNPNFKEPVGLMDGGIVDNQGIGSTMLADKRRKENGYDLILGCDVASYYMEPWRHATDDGSGGNLKQLAARAGDWLKGGIWKYVFLIFGLGSTYFGIQDQFPNFSKLLIFGGGAMLAISLILFAATFILKAGIKIGFRILKSRITKMIPPFFLKQLTFLDDLKISLLKRMLEDRISSSIKMVNEIFLKQIRRLNYQLFYAAESLKNRRALVLIYQLTKGDYKESKSNEIGDFLEELKLPIPNDKIFSVAQVAFQMETTLWFTPEDEALGRLEHIIACGQFSVCYTLMDYLSKLDPKETNSTAEEIAAIKKQLEADWGQFLENPFWLIPNKKAIWDSRKNAYSLQMA